MRVIRVFRELEGAIYGALAPVQPILEIGDLDAGVFTRDTSYNSDLNDPYAVASAYESTGNSGYNFSPAITPTARFISGIAVFTNLGFVRDYVTNPNADIIEAATIGFNYPTVQIISSLPFNISNASKVMVISTVEGFLFANRKIKVPIRAQLQDANGGDVAVAGVTIVLNANGTTLTGTLTGVTSSLGLVVFPNVTPSNGTGCDMAASIVVSSLGLTPFIYNTVILQKEIIKPRRSEVAGAVPLATEMETYEVAINITDKKIFAKKSDGTVVVVAGDPPDMTNANTAYTERRQWDGGSTNLNATTAKTSLGLVPGVDVQGFDADLQAISLLASGTGLLKNTGGVWSLDSSTYITGNSSAINAATLNSQGPSYYLDYNNLANKPSLSGGDASTLNSQPASYYLNYTNLSNKPTIVSAVNAVAPIVATTIGGNTTLTIPLASTSVPGYMSVAQATSLNTVTASTTQNRFYASPATAAGVPTFRNILASDVPTLNQNTTGSSSSCTGNSATASSLIGVVPVLSGGTGVTSKTGTGSTVLSDAPLLKGQVESVSSPTITSGALNINCANATVFSVSFNANITSLSFTNFSTQGATGITLLITYAGGMSINWPSFIKWPNGVSPTLNGAMGIRDVFVFFSYDAGGTFLGFVSGVNYDQ